MPLSLTPAEQLAGAGGVYGTLLDNTYSLLSTKFTPNLNNALPKKIRVKNVMFSTSTNSGRNGTDSRYNLFYVTIPMLLPGFNITFGGSGNGAPIIQYCNLEYSNTQYVNSSYDVNLHGFDQTVNGGGVSQLSIQFEFIY